MNELEQFFTKLLKENKNNYTYMLNHYKSFNQNVSDCILAEVVTGGASGGNCWNDDPACPYKEDRDEIASSVASEWQWRIKAYFDDLGISEEEMNKHLNQLANENIYNEIDEYTDYEYYGNYTTHALYSITVKEALEPFLSEEQKIAFEKALELFNSDSEKVFKVQQLSKSAIELEAKLQTFDANKSKERNNLTKQLQALEKKLATFDSDTYKEKKSLKTNLEQIQKDLADLNYVPEVKTKSKKSVK